MKKLKEDKVKQKEETKSMKDTNTKLKQESDNLTEELNRLKLQNMQALNFQESSFTLNRSID